MRYLYYTNYQSGRAGLSNGIMSIEVGVILAHLTNRLLVLDGNVSPPANIVAYDGRVDNRRPSRITDLLDIPVPWVEPDAVGGEGLAGLELTSESLADSVLYFPNTLDTTTSDAKSFARGRLHWQSVHGAHDQVPVLRLSEVPLVPGTDRRRDNLSWYSYLFYLDSETRRSVYQLLQRMQAKRPFAELAERVARDLGPFNAVHLRRGDFKVTYGVTTLDRKPIEAIEALEPLFSRAEPLVIVTDERDDPFFREIKLAYPKHHFIDWHILDNYGADFAQLPQTDSLTLAYLSQLVAAEAKEFVGTMTSTFTGLIQRYRGNRGKSEMFRYLWNELPDGDQELERGRHAISECIPLERGRMVEQFPGPYSWNRVSQLLNPAWMREWPESFLTPEGVAKGALVTSSSSHGPTIVAPVSAALAASAPVVHVTFEKLQVGISSRDAALLTQLAPELGAHRDALPRNVIASFEVSLTPSGCCIEQRGRSEKIFCAKAQVTALLKQQIASVFAAARHKYAWLMAAAFAKNGRGLVIAGEATDSTESLRRSLEATGWMLLDGGLFAVRVDDLMLVPMGARTRPEGAASLAGRVVTPLDRIVIARRAPLHVRDGSLTRLSPAATVVALISASLDFHLERHRAVSLLCRVAEQRPAAQVSFGQPEEAARLIASFCDGTLEVAA